MKFPIVSKEICDNIALQFQMGTDRYVDKLFNELKDENPELGDFIVTTINKNLSQIKSSREDKAFIFTFSLLISMCTYNAIKQQIVCDELREAI